MRTHAYVTDTTDWILVSFLHFTSYFSIVIQVSLKQHKIFVSTRNVCLFYRFL